MHFMEHVFCFTYNSPAQVFGLFMECTNLTLLYSFRLKLNASGATAPKELQAIKLFL